MTTKELIAEARRLNAVADTASSHEDHDVVEDCSVALLNLVTPLADALEKLEKQLSDLCGVYKPEDVDNFLSTVCCDHCAVPLMDESEPPGEMMCGPCARQVGKQWKETNERLAEAEKQRDIMLLEAQVWATEAKTQRVTVNEVGSALGGIPDWGPIAQKVRERIEFAGAAYDALNLSYFSHGHLLRDAAALLREEGVGAAIADFLEDKAKAEDRAMYPKGKK